MVDKMQKWKDCVEERAPWAPKNVAGLTFENHGNYLQSGHPYVPQVGDVRLRFRVLECGDCTVLAVQEGASFKHLTSEMVRGDGSRWIEGSGDETVSGRGPCDLICLPCTVVRYCFDIFEFKVYELIEEAVSAKAAFAMLRRKANSQHDCMKTVGWCCLVFGLAWMFYLVPALLASPFSLIYGVGWDIHDFITRVGQMITNLLALLVGTALYFLTYAASWIIARPLKGIPLFLLGLLCLALFLDVPRFFS
jgi:hypothetical protein